MTTKTNGGKGGGVAFRRYAWGAIFTGSADALIRAGLLDKDHVPARKPNKSNQKEYWLPLNWRDGYNAACFGPGGGRIPPRWDAVALREGNKQEFEVRVKYNPEDLDVSAGIARALSAIERGESQANIRFLVERIAPRPLPEVLRESIAKARQFPTNKQLEQMRRTAMEKEELANSGAF